MTGRRRVLAVVPAETDDRTRQLLSTWTAMATTDLVVGGPMVPPDLATLPFGSSHVLPEVALRSNRGRAQWLLQRRIAFEVAVTDPRPARARLRELLDGAAAYDAVVVSGVPLLWALQPALPPVPLFLDVPQVGTTWCDRQRADAAARRDRTARLVAWQWRLRRDRWFRFELRYAAIAHAATVTSEAEREALGTPGVTVVPTAAIVTEYPVLVDRVLATAGRYTSKGR